MVYQEKFTIATNGHRDMHDLTQQVAGIVVRSIAPITRSRWRQPSRNFGRQAKSPDHEITRENSGNG
jgi:hypothetical protein